MKTKILIITYYWPPSGGAGVQRWLKYVRYLLECGIEPVVVTVDAQKASYPVIDNSLLYEIPNAVKVHSTDTYEPFEIYRIVSRKKQIPFAGFANEGKVTLFKILSVTTEVKLEERFRRDKTQMIHMNRIE